MTICLAKKAFMIALVLTLPILMGCRDESMPAQPGAILPNPPRPNPPINIQTPFVSVIPNPPLANPPRPNPPRSIQTPFVSVMPNLPTQNIPIQNPARNIQEPVQTVLNSPVQNNPPLPNPARVSGPLQHNVLPGQNGTQEEEE